ncbi:MAG: aminoglycoside phosphotransferase family protein [Ktedonobacterales bacterium]
MSEQRAPDVPDAFRRAMIEVGGEEGRAWLDQLSDLLTELAGQWALSLGPPVAHLTYNYVAPVTRADGAAAILKVAPPNNEFSCEVEALRLFDGQGMARLLAADLNQRAALIERLEPGTALMDVLAHGEDDRATRIAADVLRRLWRPAPPDHPFPTTADWGRGFARLRQTFGGATGPFPAPLVEQAERLFDELHATAAAPVLLHGDLNYGNVLLGRREAEHGEETWLAIDPKGLVGEPIYDTGVLLRDPVDDIVAHPQPRQLLERRIALLADELGFDRERLRLWGMAQAVLSAWWTYEDHGVVGEGALACAAWLAEIRA